MRNSDQTIKIPSDSPRVEAPRLYLDWFRRTKMSHTTPPEIGVDTRFRNRVSDFPCTCPSLRVMTRRTIGCVCLPPANGARSEARARTLIFLGATKKTRKTKTKREERRTEEGREGKGGKRRQRPEVELRGRGVAVVPSCKERCRV